MEDDKYLDKWLEAERKIAEKEKQLLQQIKFKVGEDSFKEIEEELRECEYTYNYKIVDKPIGKMREFDECEYIEGVYVNQTTNGGYTGDEFAGTHSIKIADNEYFQFSYSI